MGKANRKKIHYKDAKEMVSLVQTLKDIADNKLYVLLNDRSKFRRFGETFVEFFRLISFTEIEHPLIANKNDLVGIVVVTVEGSFLGKFNGAVLAKARQIKSEYSNSKYIAVGEKSLVLKEETPDLKSFTRMADKGLYETAVEVKKYIVDEVMNGRLGKIIIVYSWPKDIDTQKPRSLKILPCEDLLSKQTQFVEEFENVIQESDSKEVIGKLADLWITTRLYEVFFDSMIASAAAQAAFLEESVDRQKKEEKKALIIYRKAKKSDIDTSLRETFAARMMAEK